MVICPNCGMEFNEEDLDLMLTYEPDLEAPGTVCIDCLFRYNRRLRERREANREQSDEKE